MGLCFLGLMVDSQLKFKPHINLVRSKTLRLIGLAFHSFHSKNPKVYFRFYLSYIIPIIDYAAVLYLHAYKTFDK